MSIKLMSRVWEKELDHASQLVLLAMADHADDDGKHCFPSRRRIAWKTGYSERQVQRIGQGLLKRRVLIMVNPPQKNVPAEYNINLAMLKDKPPIVWGDKMSPDDGETISMVGETNPAKWGDIAMTLKPSIEPSDHKPSDNSTRSRAPQPAKKKTSKPKDMRHKHPAIALVRGVMSTYPGKAYWDDIIELADPEKENSSNLDSRRLKDILQIFLSVGGYANNVLCWLFDWYVNGVPDRYLNRPIEGPLADKYRKEKDVNTGSKQEPGRRLRKGLNE